MIKSAAQLIKHYSVSVKSVGNIDLYQHDSFVKVVLNRPKALNSLNLQMIRDFQSELNNINNNKAFWIEGAGSKAFCAGGDVKALFEKDSTPADRITFFREQFVLNYKISQLKALQVVNWDGIVMGGGFGVSAFAPFIIATENTMFAMPEAKLGFFTDVGSSYLLARLRSHIGYYMGITGARLKGEAVYLSGLAHYYIPSAQISQAYLQIQQAVPKSTNPRETIKQILQKYHKPIHQKQIDNQQAINQLFSLPTVQQIYNKAQSNNDKFHQTVVKQLNEQCPVSISVIHKLITAAKKKSIRECFIQDFYVSQHMSVDPNFAEGVRCVLVDKGATPSWSHKHINQVKQEHADRYLSVLPNFEKLSI